jgi:hypothetical protein
MSCAHGNDKACVFEAVVSTLDIFFNTEVLSLRSRKPLFKKYVIVTYVATISSSVPKESSLLPR